MKIRLVKRIVFTFASVVLLASCGSGSGVSPTTGWAYDDPAWGGFESASADEQQTPPGMVFVEGGNFTMGSQQDQVTYDWNNVARKVTVSSFFMDECEVTNIAYREYLDWLRRVYPDYPEVYRRALPDTLCWRNKLSEDEKMVDYYFRHPEYAEFPVVGVSWLQANDYCAWRTDRVNEAILIDAGILELNVEEQNNDNVFTTDAYMAGLYEGIVNEPIPDLDPNSQGERVARMEDGILLPKFRLPTEAEWEFAAWGLIGNTIEERQIDRRVYPWNGYVTRSDDKKYYGQMLANFKRGRGDAMGVAGALNDHWVYTNPVTFFFPNDYGLYNMAGNVAEWVMDVYRAETTQDAYDINPFRGNVYMTKVLDADGLISEKDSLGRIAYREVTVAENINRNNYKQADNINYLDGDLASQITSNWKGAAEEAGDIDIASSGEDLEEGTAPKTVTDGMYAYGNSSLVSDKARVVKGGSWKDRAFYLSPGERRFLDQSKSACWIGFRCAMDKVGFQEAHD
ncbi:MAG: SUMF1/EgtB/PvdO family nonheme iron enzyme [Bacteroidales bacterium]|jgi:gliding motility-associated lipoprotein GldJ|nr:SUMF1/EgtB/PvdO family nonheme iron enzyme [Bacteroidales bacterium]